MSELLAQATQQASPQGQQLPHPIRGLIPYQGLYLASWVKWLGGLIILLVIAALWYWRKRNLAWFWLESRC